MGAFAKISDEVRDKILSLYKSGIGQTKIGEMVGVSRATVYRTTGSKKQQRKITKADKELIWKLRGEKVSIRNIVKKTGISSVSVTKIAKEKFPDLKLVKTYTTRKSQKRVYPKELIDKVRKLAKTQSTVLGISKALGTTRYAIGMILKENEIKLTRPSRKAYTSRKANLLVKKEIKPFNNKEVKEHAKFKTIDPIKGKVKFYVPEKRMEVYVYPHQLEEAKRKYNVL